MSGNVSSNKISIKIANKSGFNDLPVYQTVGSAGCDIKSSEDVTFYPGETVLVPTGLHVAIPTGYEIQIRPRSGLSLNTKLRLANSIGTIDSDYRGEIKCIFTNTGDDKFVIKRGDRIAQFVVAPVYQAEWQIVETLDETNRGTGGFGSTGS